MARAAEVNALLFEAMAKEVFSFTFSPVSTDFRP